ncbi:hypothetical protein [Klebsiella phage IME184]|uniref:Uncharacterized protein n=1 Tax=Klebsiella phage IME184 TaxID=2860373 RepID=A0AC61NLF8_9CAUD|nr:hypothetical protein [Klebsiella phage IME184]
MKDIKGYEGKYKVTRKVKCIALSLLPFLLPLRKVMVILLLS